MLGLNFGKIYFWKLTNPTIYSHMEEKKITHFFYLGDKLAISRIWLPIRKLSVIRQKGESQNRCFKKTKHAKFYEKQTFLALWYAHARVAISQAK